MKTVIEIGTNNPSVASQSVVMHHLSAFRDNDLKDVMSDYTSESVVITPDATYKGIKEIEAFLGDLMTNFPKQKSTINLDKMVANGDLVYIVWNAQTPTLDISLATDTFIIKGDKIHRQTFAGVIKFIGPAIM